MNFRDVYKHLLEGKKIRRKEWKDKMHIYLIQKDLCLKCKIQESVPYYYDLSIFTSNDWIIHNEKDEEMNLSFPDAIEELKKGKEIKLKEWPKDTYLKAANKDLYMNRYVEYDFIPTYECLLNNDWELLDES